MKPARPPGTPASPGRVLSPLLPAWQRPLAVIAHPDDETFGLGAIISQMAAARVDVHILCYTHGEASTLNHNHTDLLRQREYELRKASAALGAAGITLLRYRDGGLAGQPPGELADRVTALAALRHADGLLVFDDNGVTGHPDHQAATAAAVRAGSGLALPVLAWALPADVAGRLQAETGQPFAGQPPGNLDFRVAVDRACQRQAAWLHASQISPTAVLWRRLDLQGDTEHLRWLLPPGDRRSPVRSHPTAPWSRTPDPVVYTPKGILTGKEGGAHEDGRAGDSPRA
jgi:LmbE family N-acetylglucosaminyl deacetylase